MAHRAGLPRATGFSAPSAQPSPAGSVPRVGIPAFPALGERSEEAQPHPDPCPTGGGDPELEAAQLLLSRREGSSAALGEAGEPSGAPDPRISRAPARRWSCWLHVRAAGRGDLREYRPRPRPLRLALRPRASPRGQSVPRTEKPAQTRFASSRCPPIRALVCGGRVTHGQSPRDPGFFAVFTSLLFPLQLELVRPGSWRKSLRPPRTRPQTRRAASAAGGEAVSLQGGSRARLRRDGSSDSWLSPSPPPSRVPGLAWVPRSQRRLQPPAPAHVGPEAGGRLGALSVIRPGLGRAWDPKLCGLEASGPALWGVLCSRRVSQPAREILSLGWRDLDPPALGARGAGALPKARTSSPGCSDISVGRIAL